MEKYLNDSLSTRSKADSARIEAANLMPAYFKRLQYREDSIRAFKWFQTTRDSVYIERYTKWQGPSIPGKRKPTSTQKERSVLAAVVPHRIAIEKKEALR